MSGRRSTVRGRELGRRILAIQRAAGQNGMQLADKLGLSPSLVSRMITGHRPARPIEVATFLALYGVLVGPERDKMLEFSEPYHDETGLYLSPKDQWSIYLEHARDARSLVEYQPFMVPWILQTSAYTRALIGDSPLGDVDRELLIVERLAGKDLVRRPQVELFVHELALRNKLGDSSVMSEQLHHLIRMSVQPSLSLRLVPAGKGVYAGLFGSFTLLESSDYWPVLYREDHGGARLLDDPQVVAVYRLLAQRLRADALNELRSRERVGAMAVEMYGEGEMALTTDLAMSDAD